MKGHKAPLIIYISGLYSGPNPSPGVGIARSLRQAYPEAVLIGVDYSNRSSGLHWSDFDDLWLQRPWNELDLEEYASQIRTILNTGALWISGLDLETIWLAQVIGEHPNLLIPPLHSLLQTMKPAIPAHNGLPVRIPPYVSTLLPDAELHKFCRKHGWPIWVKGPWYEAMQAESWRDVTTAVSRLAETWATDSLFLQAHVVGYEESIAFCAFQGQLLGSVYMKKREITPEGKTWAGHISEVPTEILEPLREIVGKLNWTGGAELECVRDVEGELWLLEWNPRFPAWIHGATIAGHNLPALLVECATGARALQSAPLAEEFTRVVLEIPVRPSYPLPPLPEPVANQRGLSFKHPSGMPTLAKGWRSRLADMTHSSLVMPTSQELSDFGLDNRDVPWLGQLLNDLARIDLEMETPCWLFFDSVARYIFQTTVQLTKMSDIIEFKIAYSVKTNPDKRLLELAKETNLLAECISQYELEKCISVGFQPEDIILNGPGKWWPGGLLRAYPVHALFCDSLEEMSRVVELLKSGMKLAQVIGVRIRPPQILSRFGVPVSSFDTFRRLVNLIKSLPPDYAFGLHFHIPSNEIGMKSWWSLFESVVRWAKAIQVSSGREVQVLDIGGGFFPGDLQNEFMSKVGRAVKQVRQVLPSIHEIIAEPGKGLVQPAMGLAVRVLEVRRSRSQVIEAVVDGSIAELPEAWHYPHRVLWLDPNGEWKVLGRGSSLILGRLCMEGDILATGVDLPQELKQGDILIFCDAGAYDRSMAYAFGRG